MKKILALLVALCLMSAFAAAETSETAKSPLGIWASDLEDEAKNNIFQIFEDGTCKRYSYAGTLTNGEWEADYSTLIITEESLSVDAGIYISSIILDYSEENDTMEQISAYDSTMYRRLSEEEFEAILAELSAETVFDPAAEDFYGQWKLTLAIDRKDPSWEVDGTDDNLTITINENGMSIPDGSYAVGASFEEITDAPCTMLGNRLVAVDALDERWYLYLIPDGRLRLSISRPRREEHRLYTFFLEKISD